MAKFIVGVMGAGEGATEQATKFAQVLGKLIAANGWIVLSGGRNCGVMQAVNQGAKQVPHSLTIGILPSSKSIPSPDIDIVIVTDLHNARNNINVLSSNVVVACGEGGAGTASEIALAIKAQKPVILLGAEAITQHYFQKLGGSLIQIAHSPEQVIAQIKCLLPDH